MEENNVHVYEVQEDITIEETIDVIEVSELEDYEIDLDEAFPPMGVRNDELNHALLNNRELPDQHPIMAITGLREELDGIEALQTIYSNEKGCADYYEWADGNILAEDRIGYFVTLNQDTRTITVCAGDNIFGVVVDNAAFIGGQDDIVRDFRYGLVATSGPVHIRCELDVAEGDYVVSNEYGIAKKSNSNYGYLVVALHDVLGTQYATINLNISATQVEALGVGVQDLNSRIGIAEENITAAINIANQAYNKADEISEEALKNALEALDKANDAITNVDKMNDTVTATNEIVAQARAIAESAATSAESIRNQAVATANDALANVNNLIENLEPISQWKDPETGNVGAEYLTTYIENGLATKAEIQTVETLTSENKSAILQSTQSFENILSSVDKYSVGEYSQAYGLSREQAKIILKVGMIYIPTKHSNTKVSHNEIFTDDGEVNSFTPGHSYIWTGEDWEERLHSVVFSNQIPTPNSSLQYWYIDAKIAPEGYEPYALYAWIDEQWTKVNVLDGNITNRIVSMVRQSTDEIALEVTNARGGAASLNARIQGAESKLNSFAYWPNEENEKRFNMATIDQSADGNGSSLALAVIDKDGDNIIKGATIVLNQDDKGSYIQLDADAINFTAEDYSVIANNIDLNGYVTISGVENGTTTINGECIKTGVIQSENYAKNTSGMQLTLSDGSWDSKSFKINSDGEMTATGGKIAGWHISDEALYINIGGQGTGIYSSDLNDGDKKESLVTENVEGTKWSTVRFFAGAPASEGQIDLSQANFAVLEDGSLYATSADINGRITTKSGKIGGWEIKENQLIVSNAGFYSGTGHEMDSLVNEGLTSPVRLFAGATTMAGVTYPSLAKFAVLEDGSLYAKGADIEGTITASKGKIAGFELSENGFQLKTVTKNEEGEEEVSMTMSINAGTFFIETPENGAITLNNRGITAKYGTFKEVDVQTKLTVSYHGSEDDEWAEYDVGGTLAKLLKNIQTITNRLDKLDEIISNPDNPDDSDNVCGICGAELFTTTVTCPGGSCSATHEVSYCPIHGPWGMTCPECGEHWISFES